MKRSAWLAILLVASAAAAPEEVTYYVRAGGDDRADGRTPKTAFRTVLRAAQVLDHGDRVVIGPGTYRENVLLAERHAADGSVMSISGDESGRLTGDPAGPVVIQPAGTGFPALRFHRVRHLALSGLTFRGPGDGLVLEKCLRVAVERCTFSGLRRGLNARFVEGLRVESSKVERCAVGLSLQGTSDSRLAHLTVVNCSCSGVLVLTCGPGQVRNSILVANNTNLLVDAPSAPSWSSDSNVIHGTSGPWGFCPMVYFAHEWFAASGQDRHSVHVAPPFVDPAAGDFRIDPEVRWGGGLPGRLAGRKLSPEVVLDRDGKPFAAAGERVGCGAYAYPEARPAAGWKRLPVSLKPGTRQSAGVYRADGTLVRMLVSDVAGVEDLWWDGLDDAGQPVPAGDLQVRSSAHDVRVVDDGHFGDNGNPLGTYNCDNGERLAALPDGRFVVATVYDEAGIPLRFHAPSGQSCAGVNLSDKEIWAIAATGDGLVAGIGPAVARITLEGERAPMANGAESFPILAEGEKLPDKAKPMGLAVIGETACVALPGLDVVRVIGLRDGRKVADWKVPSVGDLAADEKGVLWALSGKELISLGADGRLGRRFATSLDSPRYLAAAAGRFAVVDREAERVAILDGAGQVMKTLGRRPEGAQWLPVAGDVFRNPRGAAWLPDGRLLMAEAGRVRAIWPDTAQISFTAESNFMDVAVPHPARPEYVYCYGGMGFRVDPKTGAWTRVLEAPGIKGLGSLSAGVVLGGKPFIVGWETQRTEKKAGGDRHFSVFRFIDVADPLKPRLAAELEGPAGGSYAVISFTREGHLVMPGPGNPKGGYGLAFRIVPFKGLDARGAPQYDFKAASVVGTPVDAAPRGMAHNNRFTVDRATDEIYYTAVTRHHNKMVPAWGASATGAGKSRPDGTPLWFSLSSGGNSTSMGVLNDGKNAWFFVPKDFGGQVDVFDADGLRVTTGNWGWASNWQMGFVDLTCAFQPYLRPDGKPGAWVEDDNIGRFTRIRLDGGESYRKTIEPLAWNGSDAPAGDAPVADRVAGGKPVVQPLLIPRVPELKVNGDWEAWAGAGVVPQVISLPTPTWGRSWPDDLMQSFRAATSIGAFAHDGRSLYVYLVTTDDTPHFDSAQGGRMWEYDSIELWLEEEQFGLGFVKGGKAALFKYRYHDREGKEWAANYALPEECIWGRVLPDLSMHPLGRQLGDAVGVGFKGRAGYALMARIPFEEIRLKGGLPGSPERAGTANMPCMGKPGEVLRIGVAYDGISARGREQDFKVYWPVGLMYSDPTRNVPFALGE
jgi:hypothetical protein